jgi:hypothetical protein
LFWLLNEAKETVIVGAEKWLFLTSRVVPFPDSDRRATHTAARLAALARRLDDAGIRLVVVPIPRKSAIYETYLPRGLDPQSHLDRLFLYALNIRGVPSVDLLTPFILHAGDTLYFRNGAHWTPRAEVMAAEQVCRDAGILTPETKRSGEIALIGREHEDLDILRFLGLELSDTKTLQAKRFRRFFAKQTVPGYDVIGADVDLVADGTPDQMKRIAIFGTSFTALRRFPRFIGFYAGEPVWNGAEPGGNVGRLLLSVLRERGCRPPPELMIVEMPTCQAVREGPSRITGELFMLPYPTRYATIQEHDQFELVHKMLETFDLTDSRRRLAALTPGIVAHSADGIVSVRLRGRVSGGTAAIEVNSTVGSTTVPWHPQQTELVVPIVGYAPTTQTRIYARASGSSKGTVAIQLHDIQLVADLDYATSKTGHVGSITETEGRWSEEIRFADPVPKGSFPALELQLGARGRFDGSLSITVTSSDPARPELVTGIRRIKRKGIVIVNLRSFEGAPLKTVKVEGEGSPPDCVVRHARIVEKQS